MAIKVSDLPALTVVAGSTLVSVVDTSGASTSKQTTVDLIKTFILLGNAATSTASTTATKLATPVTIAGNSFDGSANISITPSQVGLGNVTNESKATMFSSPTFTGTVTIPAGASISGFAPLASPAFTGTVTGVSKSMVGLGNVENTALSTWAGSGNITSLGTVTSGSAPASDVYTWAKQSSKPTYNALEIGLGNVTNESKATMFASPTFTGTVTVPTPLSTSNTTVAASTAYVTSAVSTAISSLVNGAGAALDTLKELSDALGGDSNFATSVSTALGLKAPLASPTFTGSVTIPAGASISGFALLASPSFTTPTLGVATATSINKMAITAPTTGSTLAVADGKTFTVNNSITIAGTDSTTITLPSTTGTVALNNQTFFLGTTSVAINRASATGQTLNGVSIDGNAATASSATKSTNLAGGNATTLLGAIGYQSATDTTTLLTPNTSTTKRFLRQTGDGTNGAAPAWDTLVASDVPSFNLGTTSITFNRSSASQSLTGINIDGSAGSATKSTNLVGGNNTTLLGAIGYQSNTDITTLLSPNTTTTRKFIRMTGNGTNGAAPAWDTVTATDVGLGNVTNESKSTMFSAPTFTNIATFAGQSELVISPTPSSTITVDATASSIVVFAPSSTFTANFINIPASGNKTVTFTLILLQSATGFMMSAVQVAGASQAISWVGGSAPSATANKTDVVNVTIVYSSGSIARVLASVATYG